MSDDGAPKPPRSPLQGVSHFIVPVTLANETLSVLRRAGEQGNEAFVLWGGRIDGEVLEFESAIVPPQTAHRTPHGLLVTVEGSALFQVNKELYQRGQLLAGQVHSHPTDAYHSDTDDCHSLVTLTGALSVVIPDFARGGLESVSRWAWYRLTGQGEWAELTRSDKVELRHPKDI